MCKIEIYNVFKLITKIQQIQIQKIEENIKEKATKGRIGSHKIEL